MAGVKITDRDLGFRGLLRTVKEMGDTVVRVGIAHISHDGSDLYTDEIAAIHEFGNDHVPQRSFLRAWVDEDDHTWRAWLKDRMGSALFRRAGWAEDFARYVAAGIKARIQKGIGPELAESTRKAKARRGQPDTPLIATEQLINALEWDVKKGGGGE